MAEGSLHITMQQITTFLKYPVFSFVSTDSIMSMCYDITQTKASIWGLQGIYYILT